MLLSSSPQKASQKAHHERHYSRLDGWLHLLDHARLTLSDALPQQRPRPQAKSDTTKQHSSRKPNQKVQAKNQAKEAPYLEQNHQQVAPFHAHLPEHSEPLSSAEQRTVAGCLRVNHTGEVCAQALYLGQATQAKCPRVQSHLLSSAVEEEAHLQWCAERLRELKAKPSKLNPVWYALSFGLGAAVARLSDRISLGFIHATENQVMHHLEAHIAQIPPADTASLAILEQMLTEEHQHAESALEQGGQAFPGWIQSLMWASSRVMTTLSRRI